MTVIAYNKNVYINTRSTNVILVFTEDLVFFDTCNRGSMLNCGFYPNKIIK